MLVEQEADCWHDHIKIHIFIYSSLGYLDISVSNRLRREVFHGRSSSRIFEAGSVAFSQAALATQKFSQSIYSIFLPFLIES